MPFTASGFLGAPDTLYTETNGAVLNPAYYARRFKPEALWNEEEREAFAEDPMIEPEAFRP